MKTEDFFAQKDSKIYFSTFVIFLSVHFVYWYEGDLLQLVKYILLDILRMLIFIKCFIVDFGNIIIVYSYHIFGLLLKQGP